MGDPAGIGAEVIVKALSDKSISRLAHIMVIGDLSVINKTGKRLGLRADFPVLDMPCAFSGRAPIEYIDTAISILKNGDADALVTAPINKSSVRKAGVKGFEGHTEYLASKTAAKKFAMMLVGKRMKVVLVTRHIALKDVARSISVDKIYDTIMITALSLQKYFRIKNPKIGVAALNPHAGDGGLFGDEEARIIMPAIKKALKHIKCVYGPRPADAIFYEARTGKFDAVVAMYHDQGLAPFKMLHFKDGVNLTLGLPFIRTSPDHGTAFDIAGKGIADPTSMKEAVLLACRLSKN